jgi:penicillin-binding protein 1C
MGSLDREPMDGITGSIGPALVLRAVFADLRGEHGHRPLLLSRKLQRRPICAGSGKRPGPLCPEVEEWFREGRSPAGECRLHGEVPADLQKRSVAVRMVRPVPGLKLAMDPRIPDDLEALRFEVETGAPPRRIEWWVDGVLAAVTGEGERTWEWPVARGSHGAGARIWLEGIDRPVEIPEVPFHVR